MKFGIAMFTTEHGLPPGELAALVEEHGFDSLWFPDHTHIPVASQETFPWRDGHVPVEYRQLYDPFVALTVAAGATSSLLLGTGVCLVVERDPIVTAKTVASLDFLSGGRVLFGVGAGWNTHEMANHGTDPARRFKLMRERVQAMQAIWTEDHASYEGEFVSFDRIWSWPKPVQRPHPPVLIGGNGPHAVERVIAYGDEWLPEPEPGLAERIAELHERAKDAGRREMRATLYSADPEHVHEYMEWGVHRCVFWVPPNDPDGARRRVAEIASAVGLR